jgi:hypothetical protein
MIEIFLNPFVETSGNSDTVQTVRRMTTDLKVPNLSIDFSSHTPSS